MAAKPVEVNIVTGKMEQSSSNYGQKAAAGEDPSNYDETELTPVRAHVLILSTMELMDIKHGQRQGLCDNGSRYSSGRNSTWWKWC